MTCRVRPSGQATGSLQLTLRKHIGTMKIGYVGLGAMGGLMAAHLTRDHELWIFDLNPAACAALRDKGAKPVSALADLASACDVVIMCLPRTSDVQKALFGPHGMAPYLRENTLIIDQTSGRPMETAGIAARLAKQGVDMVDAPISGGVVQAREGRVTIMASGPDKAWLKAKPILDSMTSKVMRSSSRVGDAQALKLVNNAMGACYRMATLELVALASKLGLSLARMAPLLDQAPSASFTTRHMLPARLERRATTDFSLALMVKDMNEAAALGLHTGVPMPITGITRSMMQIGLNTIGQDARLESIFELVENLTGGSFDTSKDPILGEAELNEAARHIVSAVAANNRVAVIECAKVGQRFGLDAIRMNEILNAGSAWSRAVEVILPCMATGIVIPDPATLGQTLSDLRAVANYSAATNTPLLVANSVRALYEDAAVKFGNDATMDCLWRTVS
jgi:3-hydroxyisobutyrate dehydrogenase